VVATTGGYPNSRFFLDSQYWAQEEEIMTVSLWIRETVGGKRTYRKPNKKKIYREGTVFCLRYAASGRRRWETLHVTDLNAALAARATKEAALLVEAPTVASASGKRINVDDAIATYLTTVSATRSHKTWLAYNLMLNEFRQSCSKGYVDQIDKGDLTGFVVAQKKAGQDDRTVANRIAGVVTFLRVHGIITVTLRHKYTEKSVKARNRRGKTVPNGERHDSPRKKNAAAGPGLLFTAQLYFQTRTSPRTSINGVRNSNEKISDYIRGSAVALPSHDFQEPKSRKSLPDNANRRDLRPGNPVH
jgi:hypothetical protein